MQTFENIDEYIAQYPTEVQEKLMALRKLLQKIVPNATEKISYAMPTFFLEKNLVHFAAYQNHIGFYPGAACIAHFETDIVDYKSSKGAIQFPINKPLPTSLIKKMMQFIMTQNFTSINKKQK